MQFTNDTPFPSLCFESTGPEGCPVHTVVVRATATIVPGAPLSLADEQLPLQLTDCYFGKPGASSLKYPADLAPFKPKTDIIVIATAYPPARESRAWKIGVTVGRHKKSLLVLGECYWQKRFLLGCRMSPVTPVAKLAIRYENAYGGALTVADERGEPRVLDVLGSNPVGKGWLSPLAPKVQGKMERLPMAQIYAPGTSIKYGAEYAVEGLSAIAPHWAFRQRYRGSWQGGEGVDEAPASADLDFSFYNCAHPDLIVPYLQGDEAVELLGLTANGRLDFRLPGHAVHVAAQYARQRESDIVPTVLDTLIIEPDDRRATLVWRATVPLDGELEALEARLIFKENNSSQKPERER